MYMNGFFEGEDFETQVGLFFENEGDKYTAEDSTYIRSKLAEILEQMAQPPQTKPAQVRNYAMACKPQGVRLAWECNFKHALHSSPCGCAKPQMGGKWVILGKNTKKEIKDDI